MTSSTTLASYRKMTKLQRARKVRDLLMNDIQIFDNGEFNVRVIQEDGEIWIVARDVAQALDYNLDGGMQRIFGHVPAIWKDGKRIATPGGEQNMLCLTEQGLYFFLGRSDKEKALPYQMWIAGDVVPSIRKTGSYCLRDDEKLSDTIMSAARMIFEAAGIKNNQMALALDKVAKHYIGKSLLAISGISLIAPTKCQLLTPTEIGKHFGVSGRKINSLLCEEAYQTRVGKDYEPLEFGQPFAVMLDTGKAHSDGTPIRQLKWESSILDEIADLFPLKEGE